MARITRREFIKSSVGGATSLQTGPNAATPIAEREGVPFVCATDVDPLITRRGFMYTFRTSPIVESYARDLLHARPAPHARHAAHRLPGLR